MVARLEEQLPMAVASSFCRQLEDTKRLVK